MEQHLCWHPDPWIMTENARVFISAGGELRESNTCMEQCLRVGKRTLNTANGAARICGCKTAGKADIAVDSRTFR